MKVVLPFVLVASFSVCGCHFTESSSNVASVPVDAGVATPIPTQEVEVTPPNPLANHFDEFFAEAEKDGVFTGTIIVVDGGKTILEKSYGLADRAMKRPLSNDTIFRIGSVTKQFTATAILALVEDGKLRLDDPVSKYFPEYPKVNLSHEGVDATLHHLLSHTSGIGDGRSTKWFSDRAWFQEINASEYLAESSKLPMKRKPGAAFEYLNWGYYLLGLVVERVSGMSYEAFLKTRFFDRLGMADTGTILPPDKAARTPHGYTKEDGAYATFDDDPRFKDRNLTLSFGSGQIHSTVSDLARWDRAFAAHEVLPRLESLLFQANLDDYGYGWSVEKVNGTDVQWHNGALVPLGYSALVVRVPSKDRLVVYLSNLDWKTVAPLEAKVVALATSK